MDNFHIDVTSEGLENLDLALKLGFSKNSKATHFVKTKNELILFWTDTEISKTVTPLPIEMGAEQIIGIIGGWLKSEADYGNKPDIDGDCGRGFRISNDQWGHVKPYGWQAFLRIEPAWTLYGK